MENTYGFDFKAINETLKIPTPTPLIKSRAGGTDSAGNTIQLSYVEWYNYAEALDQLCKDYWRPEVLSMLHAGNNICVAVRLHIDGFYVDNVGSESTGHSDPVAAAYAQAFKRCCAMLGLTRDLYSAHDDKEGKWRFVDKARERNVGMIQKLLTTKKIPKSEITLINSMIDGGTMHYNASVKTVNHLENADDKPKKVVKPKATESKEEPEVASE